MTRCQAGSMAAVNMRPGMKKATAVLGQRNICGIPGRLGRREEGRVMVEVCERERLRPLGIGERERELPLIPWFFIT